MSGLILAVDDSRTMLQMVGLTLRTAGYTVIQAENGQEALRQCTAQKVSLMITDVNMPVMGGLELIREIRLMADYRFLPVLFLTTETSEDKKKEARAAGATGWIVKPFTQDQLVGVVRRVMK